MRSLFGVVLLALLMFFGTLLPVEAQANIVVNGNFSNGMQNWGTWDAAVHRITNGVFEFYRGAGGISAALLQRTGVNFPSGTRLKATFKLGNTYFNPRRVTVILHSGTWNDLQACSFMVDLYQPLSTYEMEVYTLRNWTDATISFYSSMDNGQGWTQIDDVTLRQDNTLATNRVRCVDPYRAATGFGADSSNYLTNGNFSNGTNNWLFSGEYVQQVVNGVLQLYTQTGGPAANVFQNINFSYYAGSDGDIGELTFKMGNSSSARKRVSVIIHNGSFSHLYFCTYWLEPNTPLSQYRMRIAPVTSMGGVYLSALAFYVAPFDGLGWVLLDDIVLRERPGLAVVGTECETLGSGALVAEEALPAAPLVLPTFAPEPPRLTAPPADVESSEGVITEGMIGE